MSAKRNYHGSRTEALLAHSAAPETDPCGNRVDENTERVLVLEPANRNRNMISEVLQRAGVEVMQCRSIGELSRELEGGAGAILIAEETLTSEAISSLLQALKKQLMWSDISVVVMISGGKTTPYSEHLTEQLEVPANLTLLQRPLRPLTLVSIVRAALRARRRQYHLRRLLQEREQAIQDRDQFMAMLGHELRNPLGAIRTAVELLGNDGIDDRAAAHEACAIIKRQSARVSRLVDDLLDVSRAATGRIGLNREVVDLREIARRSIDDVKLSMNVECHKIVVDASAAPAFVWADPVRLEQAITNLVSNAVKYTPAGGIIRVSVSTDDDSATLCVKDNGEGIPPEMLSRIFEPFVQLDRNKDRSRGGLGLGLALVKGLVEIHGGSVHAVSEGVGRGSEFTICLPLAGRRREVQQQQPEQPPRSTARHRVLVVEDSADSRAAMRSLMRLWGHEVAVAEDGPSAVQRAREFRPDVAFVDIGLPGLNGYEVARLIREALGREIYLVALTGYAEPEDKERVKHASFDQHLVKPVEPELLACLLAHPLGMNQFTDAPARHGAPPLRSAGLDGIDYT